MTSPRSAFWVALAAAATAWFASPAAQSPDAAGLDVANVQGTVSALVGPGGVAHGGSANITVQASDDAVVVVDTGRGDAHDRVLAAIRRVSARPIRFIVNTQAGVEHTGGNEGLSRAGRGTGGSGPGTGFLLPGQSAGAIIVAHENVLSALSGGKGGAAAPFAAWPSETFFAAEHEIFNGEAIQVFHQPAAITDGDSIVFFRRSDVISTGDIFSTLTYPRIDRRAGGTINGVIDALNHIIDLTVPREKQEGGTYVVPGHGRISDEADVVEYRDMVVIIRDRVHDLMKKGKSLAEIKTAKVSFDYDRRYSTPAWTNDQFVESVFSTLSASADGPAR